MKNDLKNSELEKRMKSLIEEFETLLADMSVDTAMKYFTDNDIEQNSNNIDMFAVGFSKGYIQALKGISNF